MTPQRQIIRGGHLLDAARRTCGLRDILIEGDTILAVGAPGMDAPDDAKRVDASQRLMHPGLVNAYMSGGKMRVENYRPVGIDLAHLARKVEEARERLQRETAGTQDLCEALARTVNAHCPGLAREHYGAACG